MERVLKVMFVYCVVDEEVPSSVALSEKGGHNKPVVVPGLGVVGGKLTLIRVRGPGKIHGLMGSANSTLIPYRSLRRHSSLQTEVTEYFAVNLHFHLRRLTKTPVEGG